MRSKAWLAAQVLLAHAEVTKKHSIFSMGPNLRYPVVSDLNVNCVRLPGLSGYIAQETVELACDYTISVACISL